MVSFFKTSFTATVGVPLIFDYIIADIAILP